MEELQRKQVRLNGNFNGRLLADVLAEDLMEVAGTELVAALIVLEGGAVIGQKIT